MQRYCISTGPVQRTTTVLVAWLVFWLAFCCLGAEPPQVKDVRSSPQHAVLMTAAQRHADYMAAARQQGHQNFIVRYQQLARQMQTGAIVEICAETWPWQTRLSREELWQAIMKDWRQSPGHWRVASRPHRWAGAGFSLGTNGVWYVCVIVAD